MALAPPPYQFAGPKGDHNPLPANTDKKWEIVDLTEPMSPSYSPSESGSISDQGAIPKEKVSGSKSLTKAKRTGVMPKGTTKRAKLRKPRATSNKVTKPAKQKKVTKRPATVPEKIGAKVGEISKNHEPSIVPYKLPGTEKKKQLEKEPGPEIVSENNVPSWDFSTQRPEAEENSMSQGISSMRAKAVQALKDVREYLAQKDPGARAAKKAAKIAAAEQQRLDNIKIANERLGRAIERATRVKASLELLVREVEVANNDVIEASELLRRANGG